MGLGSVGGIAGSLVFRSQDAPLYRPGIYAVIACCALLLLLLGAMTTYFLSRNKSVKKGDLIIEELEGFRYTI